MNREEIKEKAKQELNEFSDQIKKLEQKKNKLSTEANRNYHEKLEELKKQKSKLEEKYQAVQESSELNWDIVHKTFEETAEAIKEGIEQLKEIDI